MLSPIAMLVMDIMEPSACKVPTTSKKPLSTWSFLSSHDLSWLQWTVAAGPAERREQRRQPRVCVHICAAWRGRARRWPHPLRPAAAAHYPHCGSRACQRRALAGLRTARSAGAGSRSESAQERVGRSGWGRGAQAYGTARTPRRAGPTARANPQGPRRESALRRPSSTESELARKPGNIETTSSERASHLNGKPRAIRVNGVAPRGESENLLSFLPPN
mgnify:CR=1 FL=1